MKECLWGMLQEEHDYNQDSFEWLEATDRGGLYYITDTAFDLFVEIEVFVYSHLSQSQQQNLDQLQKSACGDPDILTAWSECIINIDNTPKTTKLLQEIVNAWIVTRGHSIASMAMENHKKKRVTPAKREDMNRAKTRLIIII